jgi:Saf4/Yju2 protein
MKCRSCPNMMSIRTDPKNADYVCGEGCERKTETWDAKEFGTSYVL